MATSNGDTPGGDAGDLGALTDRYARAGGPAERMTAGLALAAGLSEKGRYLEAIRVLQEIAGAAAGPAQRAQVLRQQGWIHLRLSEYEKAYQLLGEALELLSAHNSLDLFQVYYDIAWMFYRQGYLENARNYCDGARMVLESLAGAPAEAVARARVELLHITALIDAAAGDHRAAAAGLATEIEAHRGSGDDYRLCGACSKMASVLLAQGDVAGALRYQRQAHEIAQRRGEDFRLALSHKNYGDIYYVIGDLERSLEHYRQSRQLAQSLHNRLGEVFSGGGIGRVLCCRGDCPAAL
ncbi:tetratricopeptide repeat protein, partial [bacterium]|nr:tetratricopeptide repeat protein [bacterium]